MVTKYGLSEKLGPIAYAEEEGEVFLGQSIARTKAISSDTAKMIEDEIKRFVTDGYDTARKVLTERNADWERLAQALLEYETLTGEEIAALLRGETIVRKEPTDLGDTPPPASVPSAGAASAPPADPGLNPRPAGA
jgi:cell division protease FtsH